MTNKQIDWREQNSKEIENVIGEFIDAYDGILPPESIEKGAAWYREKLNLISEHAVNEYKGELRAELKSMVKKPVPNDKTLDSAKENLEVAGYNTALIHTFALLDTNTEE